MGGSSWRGKGERERFISPAPPSFPPPRFLPTHFERRAHSASDWSRFSKICPEGVQVPPCRRYQRGEGEGPPSLSPLWFTRQGGGSIPSPRHLQKVLCEGGMGGLRCGDGGSDPLLWDRQRLSVSPLGGSVPGVKATLEPPLSPLSLSLTRGGGGGGRWVF